MNQFDYTSMIAIQHQAQLQEEAENHRQLAAAFKKNPKSERIVRFLALVRVKMVAIGDSLVWHLGNRSEPDISLNPQPDPGDCA